MRQFSDHTACLALATVLKGTLCETVFTAEVRSYPKGGRIYQPGDPTSSLYRVVTGSVALSSVAPDGEEVVLRLYAPRDVFGELCFCQSLQRHFATALEPTDVVVAPAERVVGALRERPDLSLDLIKVLSERLAVAYCDIEAASADSLVTRLARKLFDLSSVDDGGGWSRLPRHFTHDELARLLGVRRESLTRAMIDLRALGLIDYAAHVPVRVSVPAVRRFIAQSRSSLLAHSS